MKQCLLAFVGSLMLTPIAATAQLQSLVSSNTAFALNLYGQLAANNSSNLFFSPYSISTCLAMLYAGARGNTEAQMSEVLGFSTNQQQLASTFGQLQAALESDQQTNAITVDIANALWTQAGFPFLPEFLTAASNQYQASINQADFTTSANDAAVTQTINSWVAQQTLNKIQNIVPPDAISPLTRLVLANAIYFLGAWTYPFDPTNTVVEPFYLSSTNQVMAPLMHQPSAIFPPSKLLFNYMAMTNFQALELPYASNQLSMLILLPTQIDGLEELEQQLSPAFLSNVLMRMTARQVDIYLPKFTNASFLGLTNTLTTLGMSDAFTPGVANFSGIDGANDLSVSFLYHKAWIQVDEVGTQAAAATVGGVVGNGGMIRPPPTFRADHPFLFFIRDTQTGSVLFMGRLANPTSSAGTPVLIPQLAVASSSGGLTISWPYPSTGWTLQQSADLSSSSWTSVSAASPGAIGSVTIRNDGTNNFFIITLAPGSQFFRLSQP